jgi:putative selenate reductase
MRVDPVTFESSLPGVYAGGDVAADGPASIVKAAADGKAVAAAISRRVGAQPPVGIITDLPPVVLSEALARRAHREYRTPVRHTPVAERDGFDETFHTYTGEEARAEASRCVDCDTICSLCVGVCPNMALLTYEMTPFTADLPALLVTDGRVETGPVRRFTVDQTLQIAVLTDFCNECGNCVTACPTAGTPYRDKPRLYLDRNDFETETDNAFMFSRDAAATIVEARFDGATHRMSINGQVEYESPQLRATFDAATFDVDEVTPGSLVSDGATPSLDAAATMYAIWRGLQSLPQLPMAGQPGVKITHPGYPD